MRALFYIYINVNEYERTFMKEISEKKKGLISSLKFISTNQLGNRMHNGEGEVLLLPTPTLSIQHDFCLYFL
jgi:hypothetical protein